MPKTNQDFNLSEAIKELTDIERGFQEPDIDIEKAIVQHQRAIKIGKAVNDYLDSAENRLEVLDGTVDTKP